MRRRNHRTKPAETLKKTDPQFGFTIPDPLSSRADSDLKRRRRVTFDDIDHRSPLNEPLEAQAEQSVDAKTSEFAFFKKLKSGFGHRSESSNSKSSNRVEQNLETVESRVKSGGKIQKPQGFGFDSPEYAGSEDRCKSYSFSTPIHSTRRGSAMSPINLTPTNIEKDPGMSSSGFSGDKDTVRSGGSSDEKGDMFSVKRKKLNQWVKDTWFPVENPELTSNGRDLVSVLLTRLFPGTEETYHSRFPKERIDRVKRKTFVDSPKFLKRSSERYTEVDHSLKMKKDRSFSWLEPSLHIATDDCFIPRDPEEISFSFSYPKGSVYRPPLLKQRASLSFPVEDTLDCYPISRNYKPLSLGYHREESGYRSEDLSYEHREPSSALLLEWNTETRNTDDLSLITYPNASTSSSLTDNPWSSEYASSSSRDLVTKELYPLPLLSHYPSDNFHFENELERHITGDDEDGLVDLQTFHHTNSSDFLTRDYTDLSNSPVDHFPSNVSGCEIVSFPFSSISSSNMLQVSSPTRIRSLDWIAYKFQSPQAWIDS